MKYSEWIDLQLGKHIIHAVRQNAAGKLSAADAALEIAQANARTRHKLAWLKSHPEAENAYDNRPPEEPQYDDHDDPY